MTKPSLNARQFNRRVALRAAGAFAAMSAAGPHLAAARDSGADIPTPSLTWVENEHLDATPDADGYRSFSLERPFTAIAPTWSNEAGADILIEFALSPDSATWTDFITVGEAIHDAGQPDRDGRGFGELQFADAASVVRYRALDSAGGIISVPGLAFVCIDSTAGPAVAEAVGGEIGRDGIWQPPIISRASWGANETYRFDLNGEVWWPLEYQTVQHVIVHHTVTSHISGSTCGHARHLLLPRGRTRLGRHRIQLPGRPVRQRL